MGVPMTTEEFRALLSGFRSEWFKFEAQPVYAITVERAAVERFMRDGTLLPPGEFAWWQEWLALVAEHTRNGRTVQRVRILDDPPTGYQRYLLAVSHWHTAAGERIRYISRARARKIGMPLDCDWSLFDGAKVAITRFTPEGEVSARELITGAAVSAYCSLRDVALRYAIPARDIAAA